MQQGRNTVNLEYGTGYTSPPEKYSGHGGCYVTVADRCQAVCNPFYTPALEQIRLRLRGGERRWTMEGLMIWRQDSHNAAGVCIDINLQ